MHLFAHGTGGIQLPAEVEAEEGFIKLLQNLFCGGALGNRVLLSIFGGLIYVQHEAIVNGLYAVLINAHLMSAGYPKKNPILILTFSMLGVKFNPQHFDSQPPVLELEDVPTTF